MAEATRSFNDRCAEGIEPNEKRNREYVHHIRDTVLAGMASMLPVFEETFKPFGYKNGNLAYRVAIERVRKV